MNVFISGGAKNGKSSLAQSLALALADGAPRYYVATMISSGSEDDERIRRHIADRDGMGFETVECFRDLTDCLPGANADGTFLVDSVTALMQNSLFRAERNYVPDLCAAARCGDSLVAFSQCVKNAVFVSDDIYCDPCRYDEGTECYRQCLAAVDRRLAALCDLVIEVSAGAAIVHKGDADHFARLCAVSKEKKGENI